MFQQTASQLPPRSSSTGSPRCPPRRGRGSRPSDLASVHMRVEPTTESTSEPSTGLSRGRPSPPAGTTSSSSSASLQITRQLELSATTARSRGTTQRTVPSPRKRRSLAKKDPYRYILLSKNFSMMHHLRFNQFFLLLHICYLNAINRYEIDSKSFFRKCQVFST